MLLSIIMLAFIFVIGLCVGSFMNVVILRTVSEESIVFPGSKCPKCQTPLKWYHNIPVFSYLFLRGKCGFCKEKISFLHKLSSLPLQNRRFSALLSHNLASRYPPIPLKQPYSLSLEQKKEVITLYNDLLIRVKDCDTDCRSKTKHTTRCFHCKRK